MFITHTHHSELAGDLRDTENKFEQMTDMRLKLVEKAGTKIGDILTDGDPWSGQNCTRIKCWLCATKLKTGKNLRQECNKRNLVYETYCMSCEERDGKQRGEEGENEENQTKLYKYLGETCRSVWERAGEHLADLKSLNPTSHLLKHILDRHETENWEEIEFGIRVVKFTRTPFERQILEAVKIPQERQDHFLLNSRSEYNRAEIPRLSAKIGERDYKRWEKEGEQELQKEGILKEKIMLLKMEKQRRDQEERKEKNKGRQPKLKEKPSKRQKLDGGIYKEKNYPGRARKESKESSKKKGESQKRTHGEDIDTGKEEKREETANNNNNKKRKVETEMEE